MSATQIKMERETMFKWKKAYEEEAKDHAATAINLQKIITDLEAKLGQLENDNKLKNKAIFDMGKIALVNKKLREVLEWYADRKNCDNPDFAHVEVDEHGEEIADGGYKAREALKEVGKE